MSVLKIKDLFARVDTRSSLMLLPSVTEIFELVGNQNPDKARVELVTKSLEKFTHQFPLVRLSSIEVDSSKYEFTKDTWKDFLYGEINPCTTLPYKISEVTLIPSRVISLNGTIGGSRRNWVYQDHILYYYPGSYVMNALYNRRPIYVEYGTDDKLTDKSAIGFIEERHETIFIDQCLADELEYILMLKNNFEYAEMPIQLFNGLDTKLSELKSELEYQYSSLSHGKLYR